MEVDQQKIKQILVQQDYVSEADMKRAEEFAVANRTSVIDFLLSKDLISQDLLGQAIAESYQVPYADLNSNQPSKEQILKIPEIMAINFRVVLFKEDNKSVVLTTDDPSQNFSEELKNIFGKKKIIFNYSLPEDIDEALINYRKTLETRFVDILAKKRGVAPEIIEEIFEDAFLYRSSDIHFEPQEKEVIIRFRIDGILQEAARIPKEYYENILNRLKVMAHMRIDEHFAAQDGAIRYIHNGRPIDFRVSVAPTLDGEKSVLRVLSEYARSFALADLGLTENNQKLITDATKKPFGMILVVGPTGSGKSTTLYALLKILNRPEINITTIEDPVEYKIVGINQIQVNPQTNLTFAKGLRSIVRQDPDIILVGEIRDKETAEISINAALTGHLLFSTFHANDAATAIPRLLDMGAEPFLLSSTLELIVAQRLVRKICENCRFSQSFATSAIKAKYPSLNSYFNQKTVTLYQGKGCPSCNGTGFKGRTAIFEIIGITPEMEDMILTNPTTKQIWQLALKNGSKTLFEDGLDKVKSGQTTLDELLRVVQPLLL